MPAHNVIRDDGLYFEIKPASRTITVPQSHIVLGVVGDHLSEQVTFQIPLTIDGHNIEACFGKYVAWVNAAGSTGYDKLVFSSKDDKFLYYTWNIRNIITEKSGGIRFSVHFEDRENAGVLYRWGTTPCTACKILDTLDVEFSTDQFVNGELSLQRHDVFSGWVGSAGLADETIPKPEYGVTYHASIDGVECSSYAYDSTSVDFHIPGTTGHLLWSQGYLEFYTADPDIYPDFSYSGHVTIWYHKEITDDETDGETNTQGDCNKLHLDAKLSAEGILTINVENYSYDSLEPPDSVEEVIFSVPNVGYDLYEATLGDDGVPPTFSVINSVPSLELLDESGSGRIGSATIDLSSKMAPGSIYFVTCNIPAINYNGDVMFYHYKWSSNMNIFGQATPSLGGYTITFPQDLAEYDPTYGDHAATGNDAILRVELADGVSVDGNTVNATLYRTNWQGNTTAVGTKTLSVSTGGSVEFDFEGFNGESISASGSEYYVIVKFSIGGEEITVETDTAYYP